jgi:hypothetical protein
MQEKIALWIEIALLIWIVIQGEAIRRYERGVYHMHKERHEERKAWREAKRKTALKKKENGNGASEVKDG